MVTQSLRLTQKQILARKANKALACVVALFFAFGLSNTLYNAHLFSTAPALFWLVDALQFVLIPALGLWLLKTRYRMSWRALGFPPATEYAGFPGFTATLFLVVACFFGTLQFADILLTLLPPHWSEILPPREFASFAQVVPTFGLSKWVAVLYLAISAGFAEELVYRALVYEWCHQKLSARFRTAAYVLLSANLFAVVHFEQGLKPMLSIFMLGIVTALLYSKLRMVPIFMMAHMLVDIAEFT